MRSGAALVVFLACATAAYADDGELPVRISYTSPPGCPSDEVFAAQVLSRTTRARRASSDEPAHQLTVVVSKAGDRLRGRIVHARPDGVETFREVDGGSCDDVVEALGLIAALMIDPRASLTPLAPARSAARAAPPAPEPPPPVPPPAPPQMHVAESSRWHLAAGAHAAVETELAPNAVLGFPVFLEAGRVGSPAFEPTIRIDAQRTTSSVVTVSSAQARFVWTAARLEVCPFRWALAEDLTASPCAAFEGGALRGEGLHVASSDQLTRPWWAVGADGRVGWGFVRDRIFLEIDAGMAAPLARSRFYFDPGVTVHRPGPVAIRAGAGIAVRIF